MTESQNQNPGILVDGADGNVRLAHIMYALHALSAITGVLTSASIAGSFLFGTPSIIAMFINYFTRNKVRGTWLDSHWSWQLRTFWIAAIWMLTAFVCAITIIGLVIAWPIVVFTGLWVLYRVIRGWIALRNRIALPVPPA